MKEVMESRRSIRKYANRPVEEEKVSRLLESARIAPSGSNTQPWRFIVVRDDEMRKKIAEVSHKQSWMMDAPVHIVCIADVRARLDETIEIKVHEESHEFEVKQIIRDTAIAVEHMVLEAENQGLGTCWVAWFTQQEFRPILGIPDDKFVLCVLTVGYASEAPTPRPRKSIEEIVRYERW